MPVQATVNCLSGPLCNSFIKGFGSSRVAAAGLHHVNTAGPSASKLLIQYMGLQLEFSFSCVLLFYQHIRSNDNQKYNNHTAFTVTV
jgi:hypothetical protein